MDAMTRQAPLSLIAAVALGLIVSASPLRGAAHPQFAGTWTLDRAQSKIPAQVGFDVIGAEGAGTGTDATQSADNARGGGRGGRGGGGSALGSFARATEDEDDVKRRIELTAEVGKPPEKLVITQNDSAIVIAAGDRTRTYHPDRKEDIQDLGDVPVSTSAKWSGETLVVTYEVEKDRQLRYTYSRPSASQFVVEIRFVEKGHAGDVIRCVYTAGALQLQ